MKCFAIATNTKQDLRCGLLVKWLRRRPLTAKTGVRLSYGSPERRSSAAAGLLFSSPPLPQAVDGARLLMQARRGRDRIPPSRRADASVTPYPLSEVWPCPSSEIRKFALRLCSHIRYGTPFRAVCCGRASISPPLFLLLPQMRAGNRPRAIRRKII